MVVWVDEDIAGVLERLPPSLWLPISLESECLDCSFCCFFIDSSGFRVGGGAATCEYILLGMAAAATSRWSPLLSRLHIQVLLLGPKCLPPLQIGPVEGCHCFGWLSLIFDSYINGTSATKSWNKLKLWMFQFEKLKQKKDNEKRKVEKTRVDIYIYIYCLMFKSKLQFQRLFGIVWYKTQFSFSNKAFN